MLTRKLFPILAVLAVLAVVLSACTTEDSESPMDEPEPSEATAAQITEEPDAEPTEEPVAEPTDEPADDSTEEPDAEPTQASTVDDGVPVQMVMARTASCRLAAGSGEEELGVVLEGVSVNVLGRGVGAGWLAIEYPKDTTRVCWITESDVIYDGEFDQLPIYGRTEGDGGDDDEPIVLPEGDEYPVLYDVLCLRGPGSSYSTVRALLEGEIVIVHGRGVGLGWYVVAISETGNNCWLPDTAIEFTGVYEDLTIFATPPKS